MAPGARCKVQSNERSSANSTSAIRPVVEWWNASNTTLKNLDLQTHLQLLPIDSHPEQAPASLRQQASLFGLPILFLVRLAIGQCLHLVSNLESAWTIGDRIASQAGRQNATFARGMCDSRCSGNVFWQYGRHCVQSSGQILPSFRVYRLGLGAACGF